MVILIIGIILIGIYFTSSKEKTPEEVATVFLEKLLTATPQTEGEIFEINIFNQLNVDTYIIENYSEIATERMMKYLYKNRIIGYSSKIAYNSNSNVTLNQLELASPQTSEGKIYYNFKGITKVTSIADGTVIEYPITGQLGLKLEDEVPKVDTLKFFSIKLLTHPVQ